MSKPDDNWEVHWQETLAEHKASPPSAADWGGMEKLLDAVVVPVTPGQPPNGGTFLNLSAIPWSVWAISLVSLLALTYWLGSLTTGVTSQENQSSPNEQVSSTAVETSPPLDTIGVQLTDNSPIKKNESYSFSESGPAIDTTTSAGGFSDDAPPAAPAPIVEGTPARPTLSTSTIEGTDSVFEEPNTAPAPAPPTFTRRRDSLKYSNVRPLRTLSITTDRTRWEHRVDELLRSEKLVITPPSRINNGYFPAYRRWN